MKSGIPAYIHTVNLEKYIPQVGQYPPIMHNGKKRVIFKKLKNYQQLSKMLFFTWSAVGKTLEILEHTDSLILVLEFVLSSADLYFRQL